MSCLLVSEMNSLWISWFANISSYSGLPSLFLKVSFPGHLLWNWSRLCFAVFGLFLMALGDGFQKTLQCCHPNPKRPCSLYHPVSYVFLKNFIDSLLNLRSLLFGVNFVYGVRECSNLILIFLVLITLAWSFIVSVTNVYSQHQGRNIPFSPHLHHQLVFAEFLWFRFEFLMFSETDLFSCDFFSRVSSCYLLGRLFVNLALVWILFWWPPLGRLLRSTVFDLPFGLENTQCPSAQLFKLLLQKMATRRQHYSASHISPNPGHFCVILYWNWGDFWYCVCFGCTETWFINIWAFIYYL